MMMACLLTITGVCLVLRVASGWAWARSRVRAQRRLLAGFVLASCLLIVLTAMTGQWIVLLLVAVGVPTAVWSGWRARRSRQRRLA
jgi:hypothetical protein